MTIALCSCGREWTGLQQAHCTVCHRHFSTVENFDIHGVKRSGCPHPATKVRTRRDGTTVPRLKEVTSASGPLWVSWSPEPRNHEEI